MSDNGLVQKLIELLLSWMRLLTGWVWDFFQADRGSGFMAWFADHWVKLAFILIVVGAIVDWLIWMIRWRPYWLWLRKRQIVYEEVPPRRKNRSAANKSAARPTSSEAQEYYDPFAQDEEDENYQAFSKIKGIRKRQEV